MSPQIFNILMDNIVREAKQRFDGGVEMETGTIQLILFADDLMLVTERDKDAERNVKVLDEVHTNSSTQAVIPRISSREFMHT